MPLKYKKHHFQQQIHANANLIHANIHTYAHKATRTHTRTQQKTHSITQHINNKTVRTGTL